MMDNEATLVARVSNPNFKEGRGFFYRLGDLNELSLVEVLEENKVATLFEKGLETSGIKSEEFFGTFPRVKKLYESVNARGSIYLREFNATKDELVGEGVEYILIKSDGTFPYESDNLDVLIRPKDFVETIRVLVRKGYNEVSPVREPHKFLFEKLSDLGESVKVHVHTRVEWEGVEFLNLEKLWERHKMYIQDSMVISAPSPEDYILIATAHLFFEDHNVKLRDLIRISLRLESQRIDWDYILDHVRQLHWSHAFYLVMLLLNEVYEILYAQNMLLPHVTSRIEEYVPLYCKVLLKCLDGERIPLEIPYAIPALFFIRKVLADAEMSPLARIESLGFVASDVVRRKLSIVGSSRQAHEEASGKPSPVRLFHLSE